MSDDDTQALAFYKPADDSAELKYLHSRRQALGGYLPARRSRLRRRWPCRRSSSTVRLRPARRRQGDEHDHGLRSAARQPAEGSGCSGPRVVPIVADEARTFGMASLFRQVGIYAPLGQLYQPEDSGSMLSYREDKQRPDPRGRHHRSRRAFVMDGGRHVVLDARPADAAVLHLLQRCSASSASAI